MGTGDLTLAAFILTAIGWISREIWRWRKAKMQAAHDAGTILKERKAHLEAMIAETEDADRKQTLIAQLDEVNALLVGLYTERLRHTLEEAGLPPEEVLVADGRSQLEPQQATRLDPVLAEVDALRSFLSTQDLFVLGNAYYHRGEYQDAKNIYDRILKLNPDDPIALNNRGVTYGQLERFDESLADCNRSLELRPDDPDTLNNRGIAYGKLGRYNDALTDFNRSLELTPDDPATLYNRGTTYYDLGRYDDALADFNRSLELRPDHPDTLNNRGITYAKLGRYDNALTDYNRSLELRPDDPDTLFNLACLFSLWGKTDEALAYLEKTIALDKKCREDGKTDKDFDNIRDDPRFKKLVESD